MWSQLRYDLASSERRTLYNHKTTQHTTPKISFAFWENLLAQHTRKIYIKLAEKFFFLIFIHHRLLTPTRFLFLSLSLSLIFGKKWRKNYIWNYLKVEEFSLWGSSVISVCVRELRNERTHWLCSEYLTTTTDDDDDDDVVVGKM